MGFRQRQILAACLGWPVAVCIATGLVGQIVGVSWGPGVGTLGLGLFTAATEADPQGYAPWWLRTASATLTAIFAFAIS